MSERAAPSAADPSRRERNFYLAFLAVAVVAVAGGFLPKLQTIFSGERAWPPFAVHLHAVLFYGWVGFLGLQVLLVRSRNLRRHRQMGYLGLGLAAAMVVVGSWMAVTMAGWHHARGDDGALTFLPVPLTDMLIFAVVITAAGLLRRDSAAHKRLILLATTQLLGAGFGRMALYRDPDTPWWPQAQHLLDLYGLLWVIMAAAVAFDLMTRGRPHRVFAFAIPFMLAVQVLAASIMISPQWLPFAKGVLGLG